MVLSPQPPRRLFVPLGLAIVLTCEIGGVALASHDGAIHEAGTAPGTPTQAHAARAGAAGGMAIGRASADAARQAGAAIRSERRAGTASALAERRVDAAHLRPGPNRGMLVRPSIAATSKVSIVDRTRVSGARPPPARSSRTSTTRSTPTAAAAHVGRNHLWIPSLGISRAVAFFPCTRKDPPANLVYRWGCGGHNNVYLMGHAYGVFKALHDAYVRGRLRKGMIVDYADGSGRVHRYSVIWWRVTPPTTAASWAWASLSRPSMTLQTCVGATGQDRLMVRLVQTR